MKKNRKTIDLNAYKMVTLALGKDDGGRIDAMINEGISLKANRVRMRLRRRDGWIVTIDVKRP